jgi:hypothetical protein
MIKHALKDDLIYISIAKKDFSFRIPLQKIEKSIDWKIGESDIIVFKQVSKWALQLFTKNVTEEKYMRQFKDLVQEYCPNNTINWEDSMLAVKVQNQYNWLINEKKVPENEVISGLKQKFKLD